VIHFIGIEGQKKKSRRERLSNAGGSGEIGYADSDNVLLSTFIMGYI
jgi:hypothetical protein